MFKTDLAEFMFSFSCLLNFNYSDGKDIEPFLKTFFNKLCFIDQ